jgi:hypothetical protein
MHKKVPRKQPNKSTETASPSKSEILKPVLAVLSARPERAWPNTVCARHLVNQLLSAHVTDSDSPDCPLQPHANGDLPVLNMEKCLCIGTIHSYASMTVTGDGQHFLNK